MQTVEELQAEIAALKEKIQAIEVGDESSLSYFLNETEAEIARLAEAIIGRAVNVNEAYLLGCMVGSFAIARTKSALEQKRKSKNPIRGAYAMLMNGAFGNKAKKPQPETQEEVTWWRSPDDYDPFK